ncbi:MAG: HD domain-containing protein [Anaerolineaceae bacterium]
MNLLFSSEAWRVIEAINVCKPPDLPVYLVGGAVRDLILGKPVKDFDFVCPSQSLQLAQRVKKKLGAVGFTLDDERQTARLILNQGSEDELILDFVSFVGNSLKEDLSNRDFTINTLVIDLDQPDQVIDLLNGQQDLRERRLRAASAASMQLDPLRVLRGARLKLAYDLEIEPETGLLIRQSAPELARVSGERIRDELFKILDLPNVWCAFTLLDDLGSLTQIFPELQEVQAVPALKPHVHSLWEHTLKVIEYLEIILGMGELGTAESSNVFWGVLRPKLAPYLSRLEVHFNRPIQAKRPRKSLFYLAALYHDVGKPLTQTRSEDGRYHFYGHDQTGSGVVLARAQALMLGHEEVAYLSTLVSQHMRVHFYNKSANVLSDRAIYRYYRDLGEAGVDVALISLADILAAYEDTLPMEKWQHEIDAVIALLEAWFSRREAVVAPDKWLDGDEIQTIFDLKPGPLLGKILAELQEAQASGEVKDRQTALIFVAEYLRVNKVKGAYDAS